MKDARQCHQKHPCFVVSATLWCRQSRARGRPPPVTVSLITPPAGVLGCLGMHTCVFSNSGDPKSGSCSRLRVRDPYPQTSDCNPDRARVHAGTSGSYLICGGKTNQPTNKTPELFYRKLLSSQTLSVRILLTFFLARQSIWNKLRKHH